MGEFLGQTEHSDGETRSKPYLGTQVDKKQTKGISHQEVEAQLLCGVQGQGASPQRTEGWVDKNMAES